MNELTVVMVGETFPLMSPKNLQGIFIFNQLPNESDMQPREEAMRGHTTCGGQEERGQ